MAFMDAADILARVRAESGEPDAGEVWGTGATATANWYRIITEAHAHWVGQFALHFDTMYTAPTALSTADSGVTYTFASSITPLAVVVYESTTGRPLIPGAYWDPNADYTWEGDKIRMTRGKSRSFSPVARYVLAPTTVDGSTAPTLKPDYARVLVVYRTLILWATRGGLRDPAPYRALETETWLNLLVALKNQNPLIGLTATGAPAVSPLQSINTGAGYVAI